MKREIMKDKEKLRKIVADADAYLAMATETLEEGDLNEEEFKNVCSVATKSIVLKAAINSLEIMQ